MINNRNIDNDRGSKYLWISLLIFFSSPVLIMQTSSGISREEILFSFSFLLLIVGWFFYSAIRKLINNIMPLDFPVLLLFSLFLIDFIKVISGGYSILDWLHWRKYFFLLIYFPVSKHLNTKNRIESWVMVMVFVCTIFGIIDVKSGLSYSMDYSINAESSDELDVVRTTYPYFSAIYLTVMMKIILKKDNLKRLKYFIYLLCYFVILLSNVITARRTPLFALMITVILIYFISTKKEKNNIFKISIIMIVAFSIFFSLTKLNENYAKRLQYEEIVYAYKARAPRYYVAWEKFIEGNIIIGSLENKIIEFDSDVYGEHQGSVHSLYFLILLKGGLLGMGIFLYFIFSIIRFGFRVIKKNIPGEMRVHAEAILITVINMFVVGITSTRMFRIESWLLLGYLLGILVNINRMEYSGNNYNNGVFSAAANSKNNNSINHQPAIAHAKSNDHSKTLM